MIRVSTAIGRGLPSRSMRPLLQHAQQLHLDIGGQVADFVEKDRGMVGQLEPARLPGQRARERALFPSEQLALDERRRNRRAVHPDHRPRPSRAELVDVRREQLLPGAGLAEQQHRRIGSVATCSACATARRKDSQVPMMWVGAERSRASWRK